MAAYEWPVELVRRTKGPLDSLGNDTWTETTTETRGIFAPGSSTEQVQGRDTITVTGTLYVAPGTDVRATDAVVVYGQRYEVDGEPTLWQSPLTGWTPGLEVKLRRVLG